VSHYPPQAASMAPSRFKDIDLGRLSQILSQVSPPCWPVMNHRQACDSGMCPSDKPDLSHCHLLPQPVHHTLKDLSLIARGLPLPLCSGCLPSWKWSSIPAFPVKLLVITEGQARRLPPARNSSAVTQDLTGGPTSCRAAS
jgi:hypothetical protein